MKADKNLLCTERKRHAWSLIAICLLAVLAFFPTFSNGFQMEWDDQWMVINPQTIARLNRYWVLSVFTEPSHGQIGPLNQLMYTSLYKCFGFNATAFHTASLILHLANVCLLYIGLGIILRDCTALPFSRREWIALLTTVLFAVHPLQVETVAWVSASKILLSTVFYFWGAVLLAGYLGKGNVWRYLGALLIQLLAYLSKEQAVVFPLFATLLFLWYGIRPKDRQFWVGLTPFYLLALACALHEVFYVSHYDLYVQGNTYVWWQRVFFGVYSIVTYFFKWLVPVNLNWMYLFPSGIGERLPWWLLFYPVLVIILACAFWKRLIKPVPLSILAFVLIHLLLVVHVTVLPRASVIADRYMYISIIGLNFLLAYVLTDMACVVRWPKVSFAIVSLVVVWLMALSYLRTMDWKNSDKLRSIKSTGIHSDTNVMEKQKPRHYIPGMMK